MGVFLIVGVLGDGSLAVHSVILAATGALLFACGIALAVWARLHLGRNWGMPMTQRAGLKPGCSAPRGNGRPCGLSGAIVMTIDSGRAAPA